MTIEQIEHAAKLAIMQMSEKDKVGFIKMFESGMHDMCGDMAKGFALQGIGNQQILASKAIDNIEEMSELVWDML